MDCPPLPTGPSSTLAPRRQGSPMAELSEDQTRVLGALVAGPDAWSTPASLAQALGREESATTDLLADLDDGGWLAVWERDDSPTPLVTLSPLGADRLGVRLVESGPEELARWSSAGDPEPPTPRARHVCARGRGADLAFVPDPHPSPDQAAALADTPARPAGHNGRSWPYPTMLIGQGLTPWPGPSPGPTPAAPCPACRDRRLVPHAYCLRCDRWGRDDPSSLATPCASEPVQTRRRARHCRPPGTTDVPPTSTRPNPPTTTPSNPAGPLADRQRRKRRRRGKMEARIAADRRRADGSPSAARPSV